MKLNLLAALLLLSTASMAADKAPVLSPKGYGKVQFGAKLTEVESSLKQTAMPKLRDPGCSTVRFKQYPGIMFMVENGIVTRLDTQRDVANTAGVHIGASLKAVRSLHPNIEVRPHKYLEDAHYLILPGQAGRDALLFEERHGKVTWIRAGVQPSVELVERCG